LKIVSFKICPFVQRAIGVLELKQAVYEVEYISLRDKPNWFLQASPHGQVPILMLDQGVLFESGPITEFVDEVCEEPRLHPSDPFLKARHRAWIKLATRNYLVQCRTQRSPDAVQLDANRAELSNAFRKIEAVLGEGPFFNGHRISLVDAAWFVLLYRAHIIEECAGLDFLADFPKTKTWQQELLGVEALQKSAPAGFIQEFSNFYLHEGTYLGGLMKSGQGRCGTMEAAACDPATLNRCCR
jgi:glutathione S-transferase